MTRALIIAWLMAAVTSAAAIQPDNISERFDDAHGVATKTPDHRGLSCVVVIQFPPAIVTADGQTLGRMAMFHPCLDTELAMAWRET